MDEELILKYMPLAKNIAMKYAAHNSSKRDDIISIAYLSLVRCVRNRHTMYNDNLGAKINRTVRLAILRFLVEDKTVFVPACMKKDITVVPLNDWPVEAPPIISVDLKEQLENIIQTEVDRQIINLRMQGYRDKEIGEILSYSPQRINQFRTLLYKRFSHEQARTPGSKKDSSRTGST